METHSNPTPTAEISPYKSPPTLEAEEDFGPDVHGLDIWDLYVLFSCFVLTPALCGFVGAAAYIHIVLGR